MTLCHYTIATGHVRQSPRSEVDDDVIAVLRPLLRSGDHRLPGPPGYRLRVTIDGTVLAATVTRGPAPLATVMVCLDQAGLDRALEATGTIPAVRLTLPCALADLHPTLAMDMEAAGWIGDLERCLAWAWIEARR